LACYYLRSLSLGIVYVCVRYYLKNWILLAFYRQM
jgi:hypothetical protein